MIQPLPQPPFKSSTNELLYLIATGTAHARGKKVVRYLTDPNGKPEAIGDFTQGTRTFAAGPPPGEVWHLNTFQVIGEIDTGGPATGPGHYSAAALSTGFDIDYSTTGFSYPLNPTRIYRPADFLLCGWQLDYLQTAAAPERAIWKATADFRHLFSGPLTLVHGESLSVDLSDDLSGLSSHRFLLNGWIA